MKNSDWFARFFVTITQRIMTAKSYKLVYWVFVLELITTIYAAAAERLSHLHRWLQEKLFASHSFFCAAEYIHICKRNDPQVSKCIRESIEVLRPRLVKGIPEISVPGMEPLHISDIVIGSGEGPSSFRAILKNVKVNGASDFKITRLKWVLRLFRRNTV